MSFRGMRRELKELKDEIRINELLDTAKVGYLGLHDEEGTYVVPLNFLWKDKKIYFHGSESGRKVDAFQTSKRVCFTISEDRGTIASPQPANVGTAFSSVMVFGPVKVLDSIEESTDVLQAMLEKFVPGYFDGKLSQKYVDSYRSSLGSRTVLYCIEPDQITAKEVSEDQNSLFYPGRKQVDDLKRK